MTTLYNRMKRGGAHRNDLSNINDLANSIA
jgi:hypothetical protein